METPPKRIVKKMAKKLTCMVCRYTYKVKPALILPQGRKWVGIYGSDADFCPKCDGPVCG